MIARIIKAYRDRRRKQQTQDEYAQEQSNINNMYARVFKTQEGKEVLDHLVKMNLANAIAVQGDTMLDVGVKQGRANIVSEILTRINNS